MAGITRYFTQFPGFDVLGEIESVNVVDETPPVTPLGAGVGVVCVVGEFETGPFRPKQVVGDEFTTTYGRLGWTVNGAPNKYPVAQRSAGSTFAWNGSGFVTTRLLRHAGLVVVRVDNSAGEVEATRLAALLGGEAPFSALNGQTLSFSVDGGGAVTATIAAAAAAITGVSGTFPTLFVGGETLEVRRDGGPTYVVEFTAADQSLAQVHARIDSVLAAEWASESGGELRLSSGIVGWGGEVEVVGGTARATLGLPTAPTQQVMTLTVTAAGTTALWTASFVQTIDGVATTYQASFTSDGSPSIQEVRDGLYISFLSLGVPFVTFATVSTNAMTVTLDANRLATSPTVTPGGGGTATFTTTTPGVLTLARGTGNVRDQSRISQSEAEALVGALTGVDADEDPDGKLRAIATTTPGTGSLEFLVSSTATGFGFTLGEESSAGVGGVAGTIPAGTLFLDSTTGFRWLALEDTTVDADDGGPYAIKVRPAQDDDTTPTSQIGDVDTVDSTLFTAFSVTNATALSRLSGPQLDVRYEEALAKTIDSSGVSFGINQMRSARTSEAINRAVAANCRLASSSGHRPRIAVLSPPVGTARDTILASSGWGSVGQNRDQRNMFLAPGFRARIPEIAAVGSAGGIGFSDDGAIDLPGNAFYASVRSILPPERNAGEDLSTTNYGPIPALGLESAYDPELGGTGIADDAYKLFKAAGVIAPRVDRSTGLEFMSDVTSVDPAINPSLADAKRRYFTDFLVASLHDIGKRHNKKLNTPAQRQAHHSEVDTFLDILLSSSDPNSARIAAYSLLDQTTPELEGLGHQIFDIKVRQLASKDFITYRLTSGTTVSVEEL